MNADVLNRLLIDRAVGALTPDVVALVDAYLEHEPEQLSLAQEINHSVGLVKSALPSAPALPLPPLKLSPFPEEKIRSDLRRGWWPAELAAAFVLGIGLGWWVLQPGQQTSSQFLVTPPVARMEVPGSAPAFWSAKRLASIGWKAGSARPPLLTWQSAVQNPQMNE